MNLGSWTEPLAKTRSPAGKRDGSDGWFGMKKRGEQGEREIRVLETCQGKQTENGEAAQRGKESRLEKMHILKPFLQV